MIQRLPARVFSECVVGETGVVRDGIVDTAVAHVKAVHAVAAGRVVRNHVVAGGYVGKTNIIQTDTHVTVPVRCVV